MSLTLTIEGNGTLEATLTLPMIEELDRLRLIASCKPDIELLIGNEDHQAGQSRTIDVQLLSGATSRLVKAAATTAKRFQVVVPPRYGGTYESIGRAQGGIRIDGKLYFVSCEGDSWSIEETGGSKPSKQPERHVSPASIVTENMGTIRIVASSSRVSPLKMELKIIERFLGRDQPNNVRVTWG